MFTKLFLEIKKEKKSFARGIRHPYENSNVETTFYLKLILESNPHRFRLKFNFSSNFFTLYLSEIDR